MREWRKHLPKGHIRETNVAHTSGYEEIEAEGDQVTLETPPVTNIRQAAPPREVADDIFGMVWNFARGSRERYPFVAQIIRHNYPEAFGHLSDDELKDKIKEHAEAAARSATEEVYRQKWDRGNDLDMWEGKELVF